MFGLLDSLEHRHRVAEWMDAPDADPEMLRKSLAFIRQVNTLFRYTRATLSHLDRFSRGWKRGETIRILDVATGSADVPRAIVRWGEKRGFDLRVVASDLHARTLREAAGIADRRLTFVQADALNLPFVDGAFDYAITSMFLHHLDEQQIVTALRELSRASRRGIIAGDLIRRKRAYFWISVFTLLANPMVRHDARVSVAQALSEPEVLALRDRAEVQYASYHVHFGHRFVLAGERQGARSELVV